MDCRKALLQFKPNEQADEMRRCFGSSQRHPIVPLLPFGSGHTSSRLRSSGVPAFRLRYDIVFTVGPGGMTPFLVPWLRKGEGLKVDRIPVIDLFAGPGGLGEGFSSLKDAGGNRIFQIIMSVEKDELAHKTLRLRAYFRALIDKYGHIPRPYLSYISNPNEDNYKALIGFDDKCWTLACKEALCQELKEGDNSLVDEARSRLASYAAPSGDWILIGGPPCQAYSLVGRARRTREKAKLQADTKQTLYKCYLSFIRELKPSIFVMENVKGLLSAQLHGEGVFGLIWQDMRDAGYTIKSLVVDNPNTSDDYVVQAEDYGVPQARHRVILLGVRSDLAFTTRTLEQLPQATLGEVLAGIPSIRSGFSMRNKGWRDMNWKGYINGAIDKILATAEGAPLSECLMNVRSSRPPKLMSKNQVDDSDNIYAAWYRGRLKHSRVLPNHESRTHLASDLDRYLFCSAYAKVYDAPARLYDFPDHLLPAHENIKGIKAGAEVDFDDRFRTQLFDKPSTTITSHIAKDGHYYIHPDPHQCRSLSVREAARLQTFPDDYFFEGNRTSQYGQVGNAVPVLLAHQIAGVVAESLGVKPRICNPRSSS